MLSYIKGTDESIWLMDAHAIWPKTISSAFMTNSDVPFAIENMKTCSNILLNLLMKLRTWFSLHLQLQKEIRLEQFVLMLAQFWVSYTFLYDEREFAMI